MLIFKLLLTFVFNKILIPNHFKILFIKQRVLYHMEVLFFIIFIFIITHFFFNSKKSIGMKFIPWKYSHDCFILCNTTNININQPIFVTLNLFYFLSRTATQFIDCIFTLVKIKIFILEIVFDSFYFHN